jgi:hypothetical protein
LGEVLLFPIPGIILKSVRRGNPAESSLLFFEAQAGGSLPAHRLDRVNARSIVYGLELTLMSEEGKISFRLGLILGLHLRRAIGKKNQLFPLGGEFFMSQEAQFSLVYLLIAFFALIYVQVYFTVPQIENEQIEGTRRWRSRRRRAKAGATKRRWKGRPNSKWGYALG